MNRNTGGASDEEAWILFFQHLQSDTATTLIDTYKEYLAGRITLTQMQQAFVTTLTGAHTQASHLGRRRAGVTDPLHPADEAFAATVMFEQARYLSGLISDIASGANSEVQVVNRLGMYADRLRGTANQTLGLAMPQDTEVFWNLGALDHCTQTPGFPYVCTQLAAGSPYTVATMPTWPGLFQTPCMGFCGCGVRFASGLTGF